MRERTLFAFCTTVFVLFSFTCDGFAQLVRLSLPEIQVVPEGSTGPWIGVGEQWVGYYDVIVGESKYVGDNEELVSPTLTDRKKFYERLVMDSAPVAALPNHVVKIDFSWGSLEGTGMGEFTYDRTDFAAEFALRRLGSQIIGVLGVGPTDWVQPFLYDAESGMTLEQYKLMEVVSNDGIVRSGEDRLDAWERYVAAAVARYADFVEIWLILNEPVTFLFSEKAFMASGMSEDRAQVNAERFGELFDGLTYELIKRASRVIRELDPAAKISALGSLDVLNDESDVEVIQSVRLLDRLLQRGIADEVDMISLHLFPRQLPGLTREDSVDDDASSDDIEDATQTQTPEGESISLDRYTDPNRAIEILGGTDLKLMVDEWGRVTTNEREEQAFPHFVTRLLAQNLAGGVSPLLAFEAYDYLLFSTDIRQEVEDFCFLDSRYPNPPAEKPGFGALQEFIRLCAGAVPETEVNATAPNASGPEYPNAYLAYGFSYRSFTNGLDRIVALWSNSKSAIDPLILSPSDVQSRVVVFRESGDAEIHESTSALSLFSFSLQGIEPLEPFESALVYLSPAPEAAIDLVLPATELVVGTTIAAHAQGPNGEQLAPSWRVIQGDGLGVISPEGVFRGIREGTATVVADVGIHQASETIRIVDLTQNLLVNGGLERTWMGDGGSVFNGWRVYEPAQKASIEGAWLGIVSDDERFMGNAYANIDYPPRVGVGMDAGLAGDYWPGAITQILVSGFSGIGPSPWDEPLLFFCWTRRPKGSMSDRYVYLHLSLFDRYRNPQGNKGNPVKDRHKLAEVRVGGRLAPGDEWTLISSLDKVGAPYVAEDSRKSDFVGSDGLIYFPSDVEQIEMIFEVDNRFESVPTVAQIDSVYLGPYKPLVLIHSEDYGTDVDLAWFFDTHAYLLSGANVDLYLDIDLEPGNGNEWLINSTELLPVVCEEAVQVQLEDIPRRMKTHRPLFAYARAERYGAEIAIDYAGPLPLALPSIMQLSDVKGDTNGNAELDIGDAMAITQFLGGVRDDLPNRPMADLTGNGKIDIGDALYITQILAGLRPDPNKDVSEPDSPAAD